jgi:hypothetical protein
MKELFFPDTIITLIFLTCIYLNHPKFNYIFLFTSSFDALSLFTFLVLEVVRINEDETKHGKIM